MKEDNIIVLCCQCGKHFRISETLRVKIENIPLKLHICVPCSKNIPELSEHVESPLRKV